MPQQSTRRGVLLVRAGTELPGGCRSRCAALELCDEQESDIVKIQVCCVRYYRLCMTHIPIGPGDERFELTLVIASLSNQQLSGGAKVGELAGRKSKRHSSRSLRRSESLPEARRLKRRHSKAWHQSGGQM
jgi:hypothetical protein